MVGLREMVWVRAGDLADNPMNWRKHPARQVAALDASIKENGWAGILMYNETTGRLIDGHARKGLDPNSIVPVGLGNWTIEQEKRLLASLDPIAALAEADAEMLKQLTDGIIADDERLEELIEEHGESSQQLNEVYQDLNLDAKMLSGGDTEMDSMYDFESGELLDAREVERQEARRNELPLCPTCQRPLTQARFDMIQQNLASRPSRKKESPKE